MWTRRRRNILGNIRRIGSLMCINIHISGWIQLNQDVMASQQIHPWNYGKLHLQRCVGVSHGGGCDFHEKKKGKRRQLVHLESGAKLRSRSNKLKWGNDVVACDVEEHTFRFCYHPFVLIKFNEFHLFHGTGKRLSGTHGTRCAWI